MPFTADRAFFPHKFAAIPRLTGRISLGEIALKTAVGLMSSETLLKDVESAVDFNVMLPMQAGMKRPDVSSPPQARPTWSTAA